MQKKIIIAPISMHKELLNNARSKNVFMDIKLYSLEELISQYYGFFTSDSILEIMLFSKVNYDTANSFLTYLPFVKEEHERFGDKIHKLLKIRKHLIELGLYSKNEYLEFSFSDYDIEVVGYSNNNFYLKRFSETIFKNNKITFISNYININGKDILCFDSVEEEIHFITNQIAGLISSSCESNKIKIFCSDESYLYQIEKYSKMYGINLNGLAKRKLSNTNIAKKFLTQLKKSKNVNEALELVLNKDEPDDIDNLLKTTVESATDSRLSYTEQIDVLRCVLKSTTINDVKYVDAIEIISSDNGGSDQEIFVVGFRQGVYPKIKQDNDYLSEIEKSKIDYIDSESINVENQFELINFLKSNNNIHLSFAASDYKTNFYLSSLASLFSMEKVKPNAILKDYSSLAAKIELVKMLDLRSKYKLFSPLLNAYMTSIESDYKTYSHVFSGVNVINDKTKINYSYSSLKNFVECQFKYYLTSVLKIDDNEDTFYTKLGTLAHYIFEKCLSDKKSFDFDTCFAQAYRNEKSGWSMKEETLLINIKKYLFTAVKNVLSQDDYLNNPRYLLEKKLELKLNDNSTLKGTIDKIITLNDEFVYLVDYKTGNDKFEPSKVRYGRSLQLPTYALLVKSDPLFTDKKIGGLYINNILDFSTRNPSDNVKHPKLELKGVTINDSTARKLIEPDSEGSNPRFVTFGKGSFIASEVIDEYVQNVKELYLSFDEKIRNNDFVINPKEYIGLGDKGSDSCEFCTFKDICNRVKNDYVKVIKEKADAK
jgi:ATP-dependent helicase/DNAse subunit B